MKILINRFQQKYLWFKIIIEWFNKEHKDKFDLIENSSYCWKVASKALVAKDFLVKNNIDIQKYCGNQETHAFFKWFNDYKLVCHQFNYTEEILDPIKNYTNSNNNQNVKRSKIICRDAIEELSKVALWAKKEILNSNVLGIVILNIEQESTRLQVDYIFSNFLEDEQYNICVPQKLCNYPAINIILLILKLVNCYINNHNIKYEDFSVLLRTKFISGFAQEHAARHYIDFLLRKDVEFECSWGCLLYKINNINIKADIFLRLINNFQQELAGIQSCSYDCNYWADFCNKILIIFGVLETCDQSLINNWRNLLINYIQLQQYVHKHDLAECLTILKHLVEDLEDINFDPANIVNNKLINIINLDVALNHQFDCLWICGANDINWLEDKQLNPFVPMFLQKQIKRSNEDILQKIISNIKQSLICSYCMYIDGNLMRPNRLINDFMNFDLAVPISIINNIKLESYQDDIAPKYNNNLFSGVNFLKLQAACPFKANAKIRLKADSLKSPLKFLDSNIKGIIIHKAMEFFWTKHKTSSLVKNISEGQIYQELFVIITNILNDFKINKPNVFNDVVIQVESERLAILCSNFIRNCDLLRDNSFTVMYLEHKFSIQLEELVLKIKIDRIDQIDNTDNLIIIDYKTGKSLINISDLEDPRIDEPQLLIYSLCLANVRQLMLGVIHEQPRWVKITNWLETKDIWYKNLYKIAKDFQNGNAMVDPKYGAQTCRLCDLKYMCRMFEKN